MIKKKCKHDDEIKIFRYFDTYDVIVIDKSDKSSYFNNEDLYEGEPRKIEVFCSKCSNIIWKGRKISRLPDFIQERCHEVYD